MDSSRTLRLASRFLLGLALLAPSAVEAQLEIHLVPNGTLAVRPPVVSWSVPDYLLEGTSTRAETRQSTEVVLFVARLSRGKLVAQAESAPFRLDVKAASAASGVLLGTGLSRTQLLALSSLGPTAELGVAQVFTPTQTMSALELVERPGSAFGLPGMNPGIFGEQEHVLVIAVLPAEARQRSRSRVGPLLMIGGILGGGSGG